MPISSASQENSNGHDHEMATNGAEEIDESLYSRQLYVLGADAMKKMSKSRYHLHFEMCYFNIYSACLSLDLGHAVWKPRRISFSEE